MDATHRNESAETHFVVFRELVSVHILVRCKNLAIPAAEIEEYDAS